MKNAILKKEKLDDFIKIMSKDEKVIAPVLKGNQSYTFTEVKSADEISLKYLPTILPPKKYFMPQHETLIEYDKRNGQKVHCVVEVEDLVIFGVHTCDLAGIQCLNMIFADRPKDMNYLIRKNRITLIGLECNSYCDEFASCALMGNHIPKGGYDLLFTDLGNYFFVEINTRKGEELIEKTNLFENADSNHQEELNKLRKLKESIFKPEVDIDKNEIPSLFKKKFESKIWEDIGERCLSCGNCTNVCPTCYCFDVLDIPDLNLKTGKRVRVWDSCQNEPFAKISGGESFREKRGDRKRHRFNRKFRYPVERYGKFFCTGCGRCSRTCMAKIDLKETIRDLIKEGN
ncbi:MAG: Ni/Fe hydrogenase subunit beta [Spirochaetes bacterium GWD1_27_9]|nr:MAG: Ni/Fe hydrogenase subunit beta [Spirochaetes bacterium GWB1_27_13]OHD25973.1 MAG: Ni/Fe hydrogenase subunit beta [Spirochaetes bacterium GWC1_27_15]OHD31651.1 MAG: Ni/Fe hydrogenase subunit beta [Spirochaetes bacterium GWD1_27_9]